MGSRWGHASVARRVSEICPLVAVGVRSISAEELEFARVSPNVTMHFWTPLDAPYLAQSVNDRLSRNIYISIDLDALDPSIMSAVGTPEPGGMGWWDVIELLRSVTRLRPRRRLRRRRAKPGGEAPSRVRPPPRA